MTTTTPLDWATMTAESRSAALVRPAVSNNTKIQEQAAAIIERVRREGDDALRALTMEFGGPSLEQFRVGSSEITEAEGALSKAALRAINSAIENVSRFHAAQQREPVDIETQSGVRCERVFHPIDRVGLYVPAGTAPLPSTAIMLSVPATQAGCPRSILCTPPRIDGRADPAVVVAATRAGVTEIYKVGGAQAIAAMAYGTASIPKVDKIFGPGNAWVTSAKRLVSNDPHGAAIDMPAGPSEVLVIADSTANPDYVAADLLSQAEHGADSQVVLIATDCAVVAKVQAAIARQLPELTRESIAKESLQNARFILVDDCAEAITVSNKYAPEHLILQVQDARQYVSHIRNAGSVFLGPWTPEAVGDYCSGTNHVLPTYGHARAYSGLALDSFLRHMTVQELTHDGLVTLSTTVLELAGLEGLDAHANAVSLRLAKKT